MKRIISTMCALGITLGTAGLAAAQETAPSGRRTPGINQRQRHQQKRIYRGVGSGELTRREMVRLEREQFAIRREERQAKSDGEFTRRERLGLRRELNQASRHIYRAKHNRRDRN
ncbi:MAG: hypothetical protein M3430_16320 [Acidobacteriota bacterium]|nr:hypothetical protein [Acidobacteriota bacterium]